MTRKNARSVSHMFAFLRRRIFLWFACITLVSVWGANPLYAKGDNEYIYSGMKEVFFEYVRLPLQESPYFDYIGGHYTYFFTDRFAAGPAFLLPLFDFSDFLLAAYFHTYFYLKKEGKFLPFLYGETGVTLSEQKENMFFIGNLDQTESETAGEEFYGSSVRLGAGISGYLYRGKNLSLGVRIIAYHHFFVHHFNRIPQETHLTQISGGFFMFF